jgi:uncharacterized protein (TIGR03435 family)
MIRRFCVVGILGAGMAFAQAPAIPAAATPAAKPPAFDVISIRQNVTPMGPSMGPPQFGPTPDGYRAIGVPLMLPILTAYVPASGAAFFTNDHITGLPDWATRDRFDIDAKVADEDLPEWQKPPAQKAMLQAMMQSLLTDRCKMVTHRETKEVAVYSMLVGKSGPKFKETDPTVTHEGIKLPFGGTISPGPDGMTLFAVPMQSLATLLSSMGPMGSGGRPILDKTGLTGLYDIVLTRAQMASAQPGSQDGTSAADPGRGASAVLESLGLKLEPGRAPVETLVIDHIEKPSQN